MVTKGDLKEVLGYGAVSAVLFNLGFLGIFFLVPLQYLVFRGGWTKAVQGLGVSLLIVLVIQLVLAAVTGRIGLKTVDILDLLVLAMLVAGFLAMNWPQLKWRGLYRVLFGTAIMALLGLGVAAWVHLDPKVLPDLRTSFDELWASVKKIFEGAGSIDQARLIDEVTKSDFFGELLSGVLSGYVFLSFLFLAWTWKIGQLLPVNRVRNSPELSSFRLPETWIWGLIGSWGLILGKGLASRLNLNLELGAVEYVLTNAAYVFAVLYCLQGLGIIKFWLKARSWSAVGRLLGLVWMLLLIFAPGLALGLFIGLVLLGALELWIGFRRTVERG